MKKKCTKCGGIKDETEFGRSKHGRNGLSAQCKTCMNAYKVQWGKANRPKLAARTRRWRENYKKRNPIGFWRYMEDKALRSKYGITLKQREAMGIAQNNRCAICGRQETMTHRGVVKRLSIDHDHQTDKVRALLCGECNRVLGCVRDDPERLEKAAAYLQYHKKSGI